MTNTTTNPQDLADILIALVPGEALNRAQGTAVKTAYRAEARFMRSKAAGWLHSDLARSVACLQAAQMAEVKSSPGYLLNFVIFGIRADEWFYLPSVLAGLGISDEADRRNRAILEDLPSMTQKTPCYMNPRTGSVDTADGWDPEDMPGLVRVVFDGKEWEQVNA